MDENARNDIVKLAVDAYHGKPAGNFSVDQSLDTLRQALVAANNGSTKLDYKAIRDGRCVGLFSIIEEILVRTVVEGLQGDEFFNNLVEFRNLALGDQNVFEVEDSNLFVVAEAADGTQAIRRQRIGGYTPVTIPTTLKVVKIYDELNRVLAGQVDFNKFIQKVGESFRQKLLNDIYDTWKNATDEDFGGPAFFPAAGDYSEAVLLDLIGHVEAAAGGKVATILGTKKALRKLAPSVQGINSQNDLYTLGYYGKFYGNPVIMTPQRHAVGSTSFLLDDNVLTIIAGDDKPIKVVYEGQSTIILGDMAKNQDLTQDLDYAIAA